MRESSNHLRSPASRPSCFGQAPEVGRPRILGVVDAMPEPHDPLLLHERVLDPRLRAVHVAHLEQHLHDADVGAPVKRALERPDSGNHPRVHVGQGRHRDPRRERGRVQLVVGMEDQRRVHRLLGEGARLPPEEHVQEVAGEREARAGRDRGLALADPAPRGDQRGHLRLDADGLPQVGLPGAVSGVGIEQPEGRHGRPEDVHRVRLPGKALQQRQHLGRQPALARQGLPEGLELRALGQPTVPEQEGRLLERGVLDEIVDVEAAIEKPSTVTVDEADLGRRHDDVLESGIGRLSRHGPPPLASTDWPKHVRPREGAAGSRAIVAHGPGCRKARTRLRSRSVRARLRDAVLPHLGVERRPVEPQETRRGLLVPPRRLERRQDGLTLARLEVQGLGSPGLSGAKLLSRVGGVPGRPRSR